MQDVVKDASGADDTQSSGLLLEIVSQSHSACTEFCLVAGTKREILCLGLGIGDGG